MKRNVIFLICLMVSLITFGQNKTKNLKMDGQELSATSSKFADSITDAAHTSFVKQFIFKNFAIPRELIESGKEGTEIIQFTVTPASELTNFQVINSVDKKIDENLIRVLELTNGMWKCGYKNGKLVALKYEVTMMIGDYSQDKIVDHFVGQAEKYFELGSMALFEKNNPKKALKNFNQGVKYMPNDRALLMFRGLCYYELGDAENAAQDWNRLASLGGTNSLNTQYDITAMKGYSEMKEILANDKEN